MRNKKYTANLRRDENDDEISFFYYDVYSDDAMDFIASMGFDDSDIIKYRNKIKYETMDE